MNEEHEKLKPCPLCGCNAAEVVAGVFPSLGTRYGVICYAPGCGLFLDERAKTADGAAVRWNERTPEEEVYKRLREFRMTLSRNDDCDNFDRIFPELKENNDE